MNMNDLTMGELRELQKALGIPADQFENDVFGLTAGIAWLAKRREDKSFTFDQALELNQAQITEIVGNDVGAS
jgi:hypothetical protein